jgi:hypothetical protein
LGIPWFEAGARGDQKFRFPPRPPRREPSRSVFLLPAPPTEVASDSRDFCFPPELGPRRCAALQTGSFPTENMPFLVSGGFLFRVTSSTPKTDCFFAQDITYQQIIFPMLKEQFNRNNASSHCMKHTSYSQTNHPI